MLLVKTRHCRPNNSAVGEDVNLSVASTTDLFWQEFRELPAEKRREAG